MHGQTAVNKKNVSPREVPLGSSVDEGECKYCLCFTPRETETFDGNFSVTPAATLESVYAPLWPGQWLRSGDFCS